MQRQALPPSDGRVCVSSADLEAEVLIAVRAGDAVMVKGSLGSKMAPIVKALARQYSRAQATAPAQG
jgi:UDP-N-acetylmuramoyl-tripeptide--D-alanyl-D-alanine ligase